MKIRSLSVFSTLFASAFFAAAAHAGTVICADGTIYHLSGDEITYEVACANHGGVSRSQLPGAGGIQTSVPIPPIPDTGSPAKLVLKGERSR